MTSNSTSPKYLIYGLMDPRSLLIRYIGRSSDGLKRPHRHLNKLSLATNTRCATWIKSLLTADLAYDVVILETVTAPEMLNEAECWWIAYGLLSKWPLTNHTLGGEGMLGLSPSSKSRESRSTKLKGRVFSDEHRTKISAAKRGIPKSDEHKRKLSEATALCWQSSELRQRQRASHLGHQHTPSQRAKIIAAHKGSKRSAEARANLSAGQRGYNQALRDAGIKHPLAGRKRKPRA